MQIDVDPEQDFHVVIDGAPRALSLDDLAALYEADSIDDATLIWQDGFKDWMRLDVLLMALGEQDQQQEAPENAPASVAAPDTYWVQFGADDVRSLSLQSLADAHRKGVVGDDTMVQAPGASEWVPLAVIIASFATGAQSIVPMQSAPVQHTDYQQAHAAPSPVASAPAPVGLAPSPMASAPAPLASAPAPLASAPAPLGSAPAPLGSAPPSAPPASMPYASIAAPSAPNTLAPTAASVGAQLPSVPPSASSSLSLDDLDMPAFQNTRSLWIKRSVMAVGAVAAVFVAVQLASGDGSEATAQPVGAAAPSAPVKTTPEVEAEPSAWEKEKALLEEARRKDEAALAQAANSQEASAFGASLAGEPKAKAPASSNKVRVKSPIKSKKSTSSSKADQRQFDPMNGAL